jgi:hypothetical protein
MDRYLTFLDRFSQILLEDSHEELFTEKQRTTSAQHAALLQYIKGAETPIAFAARGRADNIAIQMYKIESDTGTLVGESRAYIGAVALASTILPGFIHTPRQFSTFTTEDIRLGVARTQAQLAVGLDDYVDPALHAGMRSWPDFPQATPDTTA